MEQHEFEDFELEEIAEAIRGGSFSGITAAGSNWSLEVSFEYEAMQSGKRFAKPELQDYLIDWYNQEFPDDELSQYIHNTATFQGLLDAIESGNSVYVYVGIGDSVVRERLFTGLAMCIGVCYQVIYDKWLD